MHTLFSGEDRHEVEGVTLKDMQKGNPPRAGAKSGLQQREDFTVPVWSQPKFQDETAQLVSSSSIHRLRMEMHIPSYFYLHFPRERQAETRLYLQRYWEQGCSKALQGFSQEKRVLWNTKSASGKYLCLGAVATHPQVRLTQAPAKPEMSTTV